MQPCRIALIGAGLIGRRHADLIPREAACQLVAIADPDPAAAELAKSSQATLYPDYLSLLDQEQLDGVIVAAPNALHASIGIVCAQRGLPFLMEKPVTDTVANGLQLIEATNSAGVRAQVGHHRRFDPAVDETRNIIQSGELGNVVACSGVWCSRKHDTYFNAAWRTTAPGGGPLLINVIHDVDMLRSWFGEVESVYAETTSENRNFAVEDSGAILLRFSGGPLVTIAFSDATPSPWGWERNSGDNPQTPANNENCFRIVGTQAALEFPNLAVWRNGESWLEQLSSEPRPTGPRRALADQLAHFCRMIRGEANPRVTLEDGLANLAVIEAIKKSAETALPTAPAYHPH